MTTHAIQNLPRTFTHLALRQTIADWTSQLSGACDARMTAFDQNNHQHGSNKGPLCATPFCADAEHSEIRWLIHLKKMWGATSIGAISSLDRHQIESATAGPDLEALFGDHTQVLLMNFR